MRTQTQINQSKKVIAGNFATTASVLGLFPSDRPATLGPTKHDITIGSGTLYLQKLTSFDADSLGDP